MAWVPNRADKHNSQQKLINLQPVDGVCGKCRDVISWKKQYGKYKPLRDSAKCVGCQQRCVNMPYHQLCRGCTDARRCCAKCMQPWAGDGEQQEAGGSAGAAPAAAALSPFLRSMHAAPGERGVRRPKEQKARAERPAAKTSGGASESSHFDELCAQALDGGWLSSAEHDRLTDLLATGEADEGKLCEQLREQAAARAGAA